MTCLFGMKNQQISLQFKDVKTDPTMNAFFNFIRNVELNNMDYIGIDEKDADKYYGFIF